MVIEPLRKSPLLGIWIRHQLMLAHFLENMLTRMKMDSVWNTNMIFHFKELFSTFKSQSLIYFF